jgi:hypothetical protein
MAQQQQAARLNRFVHGRCGGGIVGQRINHTERFTLDCSSTQQLCCSLSLSATLSSTLYSILHLALLCALNLIREPFGINGLRSRLLLTAGAVLYSFVFWVMQ